MKIMNTWFNCVSHSIMLSKMVEVFFQLMNMKINREIKEECIHTCIFDFLFFGSIMNNLLCDLCHQFVMDIKV